MPTMNPGEEQRRERFANGLVKLASECKLDTAELADSLLTILIGIFIGLKIPKTNLVERVSMGWDSCEEMLRHHKGD